MRVWLMLLVMAVSPAAQDAARRAKVADLGFMAGDWAGEQEGEQLEEIWSRPLQDNMACMFRAIKDGKPTFYEFMVIEASAHGPVMKLKHFHAGLIGWEEKDFTWKYPLVKLSANETVFERADKKTRLIYRRQSPESLLAVLEREGKPREEFRYRLAK